MYIFDHIHLTMKNVLDEIRRENQNTHFMLNIFFPPENSAVYEITGKM